MDFLYEMNSGNIADDTEAITRIFNGATESQITDFFEGKFPFTMREIFLLKSKGYIRAGKDAAGNFIFKKNAVR